MLADRNNDVAVLRAYFPSNDVTYHHNPKRTVLAPKPVILAIKRKNRSSSTWARILLSPYYYVCVVSKWKFPGLRFYRVGRIFNFPDNFGMCFTITV